MSDALGDMIFVLIFCVAKICAIIIPLLFTVAYLTYAERRIIGLMQLRKGPNVVGPFGLMQPIADAIKLLTKEMIVPAKSDKILFILAPIITFTLSLIGWAVIPFDKGVVFSDINVGVLYILAVTSLGVYGIIIAGWASSSKYAFYGAIRSAAQMISYEISISLIIATVVLVSGSLNLADIIQAQRDMPLHIELLMSPLGVVFFICALAETNRHPFDLPEAESELVAGYNVEYSSMTFAMFFLGEYANMMMVSAMTTILFLGGYLPPFKLAFLNCIPGVVWFVLKVLFLLFCFIWIRATLPRYRYDQLMRIGWKLFLPITLGYFVFMAFIVRFLS
jgi:NADH-quinone oxidoreductase subunit H